MRRALVGIAAVALVAVACSGTSRESGLVGEQRNIEQARELGADEAFSDADPEQLDCIEERLRASDVDVQAAMSDPGADRQRMLLTRMVIDCIPDLEELDSFVNMQRNMVVSAIPGLTDLTLDEMRCMLRYVLDNSADPARSLAVGDSQEDIDLFLASAEACFGDEAMAQILGGGSAMAYGDDPDLDALHDACRAGDDMLCDLLYVSSPIGSEYEQFGFDCGGREPAQPGGLCMAGLELGAEGFATPDSSALPVLDAACKGGEWTSCDLLYQVAPFGSDFEDTGFTCGGRMAVGAFPNCRSRMDG